MGCSLGRCTDRVSVSIPAWCHGNSCLHPPRLTPPALTCDLWPLCSLVNLLPFLSLLTSWLDRTISSSFSPFSYTLFFTFPLPPHFSSVASSDILHFTSSLFFASFYSHLSSSSSILPCFLLIFVYICFPILYPLLFPFLYPSFPCALLLFLLLILFFPFFLFVFHSSSALLFIFHLIFVFIF